MSSELDLEEQRPLPAPASGNHVFAWQGITFEAKVKHGKHIKLVDQVSGKCQRGQMLAILGPSGAGKSTLLDCLAGRKKATGGEISFGGEAITATQQLAKHSSYVEQDDALLGVLTARETLYFSARLSMPAASQGEVNKHVDSILSDLGLSHVANNRIGTPLQRGISGGQKRRVTIGNGLTSVASVLFLDEPTSGLDSATAFEVMSSIKAFAVRHQTAVIATIHSPNWQTMELFEGALILANGRTVFHGPTNDMVAHLEKIDHPVPSFVNPADHFLKLVSTDFVGDKAKPESVTNLADRWQESAAIEGQTKTEGLQGALPTGSRRTSPLATLMQHTFYLTWRNFVNYSRNLLAYGVRLGMYLGMGALVATVWCNMKDEDRFINDRLSVHFFSVAFLGFMSVAGVPSFLEERAVFFRERRNGLYGTLPYVIANTLVVVPYLFICCLLFTLIIYWSVGLHPGANAFGRFLAYLFLGVLVAEFQSLLIAALVPIFVAALAIAAFANGFWMAVQGYFMRNLPAFWYKWAHWIDYQTFAFQLLVRSDFKGIDFQCAQSAGSCACTFGPATQDCAIAGSQVVQLLGYGGASDVLYAFILVLMMLVFRFAFWVVLAVQK